MKNTYFMLPILAVLGVFICVNSIRDSAQLRSPSVTFYTMQPQERSKALSPSDLQKAGTSLALIAKDLPGRVHLMAASTVFLVTFATMVWLCLMSIYRCRRLPLTRRGRILSSLAILLLSWIVVWLAYTYDTRTLSLLLKSFEDLATSAVANTAVGSGDEPVAFAWTNKMTGALAIFSAALLAVTAAVIVDGVSSRPAELADLRTRCASLRITLAAGAAVLAAAVIVVRSLQNWALSFVEDADVLRPIADSWTMALGTYWTLVLVAAYVPVAAIAHHAAIKMADARERTPGDGQTREQWMEAHNLNVSIKGQVTRVLLLLAPWLSGGALSELATPFLAQ